VDIIVCDPGADAGRLMTALRDAGYTTLDLPLGLLENRLEYVAPRLVICDANSHDFLSFIAKAESAASSPFILLLLTKEISATPEKTSSLALQIHTLLRPFDLEEALTAVAELLGVATPPSSRHNQGEPRKAEVVPSGRRPHRASPRRAPTPSLPPSSLQFLESSWPGSASEPSSALGGTPLIVKSVSPPGLPALVPGASASNSSIPSVAPPSSSQPELSIETEALLEKGRHRVSAYPAQAPRPVRLPLVRRAQTEEVRDEFARALREPLDPSFSNIVGAVPSTSGSSVPLPSGQLISDSPLSIQDEPTNPGGKLPSHPPPNDDELGPPSALALEPSIAPPSVLDDLGFSLPTVGDEALLKRAAHELEVPRGSASTFNESSPVLSATIPPPRRASHALSSQEPTPPSVPIDGPPTTNIPATHSDSRAGPTGRLSDQAPLTNSPLHDPQRRTNFEGVSGDDDKTDLQALAGLALAIRERRSGAVAQQEKGGIRRIVLTGGDLSTVASSITGESLGHFLHSRGDISEEVLASLSPLPGFGRHAGAALIARGLLPQDDLWPVLRSHAEWILGKALLSTEITQWETTLPARILEEPAVFGGSAGSEIFVETIRRILTAEEALSLLGSPETFLSHGSHETLLGESALSPSCQQWLAGRIGKKIGPILEHNPSMLPILVALTQLGVYSTGGDLRAAPEASLDYQSQQVDEDAFAAQVKSRCFLVEDGDYFDILGIAHSATTYEVERAREELLVRYSEKRLTSRTLHLRDEIQLLREVIEEAHLVLKDDVRRWRYRKAIEASPLS